MPTTTEIAAAATQFVAASNKAHSIVNGPASGVGSTVAVESGEIPTHAKQAADFSASLVSFESTSSASIETFETNNAAAIVAFNVAGDAAIQAFNWSAWLDDSEHVVQTAENMDAEQASRFQAVALEPHLGTVENFGGLKDAFGAFMSLETATPGTPLYVGITGFGDSMASGAYMTSHFYADLMRRWGVGAWVSPNLGGVSGNGNAWTLAGGAEINSLDFVYSPGSNWLCLPIGATASTTLLQTQTAGMRGSNQMAAARMNSEQDYLPLSGGCKKVSVFYVKEPGGGTLDITLSQDQFTNQTASVATDAALGLGVVEFTPGNRFGPMTVALVASVAQCRVIGVVYWSVDGGVVYWSSQQGGSTMTQQLAALRNSNTEFNDVYEAFFAALNTKLVIHAQRTAGDSAWQANYPLFFDLFNGRGASQLAMGEPPLLTESAPTTDEVNAFLRHTCKSKNVAFVDQKAVLGSYAKLAAIGWNVTTLPSTIDAVHLGGPFYRFSALLALRACNWFQVASSPGSVPFSKVDAKRAGWLQSVFQEAQTFRIHGNAASTFEGSATSGAGFALSVSNEKGYKLASPIGVQGYAAGRIGVLFGSPSLPTNLCDFAIIGKGYRNITLSNGLRAFLVFGATGTTLTTLTGLAQKCFGLEFAKGSDVGSPDGGSAGEVCRLFACDGATTTFGPWSALAVAGQGSVANTGWTFMIQWNKATGFFTLRHGLPNSSSGQLLQAKHSLDVPALAASATAGQWVHAGLAASDAGNLPTAAGSFEWLQLAAMFAVQVGRPFNW
jgi:hypothetical protein